ncbi:MAG: hypothetical protein HZB15_12240 [Actinobacteria bacterium]|nr:hypothetical protein [Actinomycetota bacterium]
MSRRQRQSDALRDLCIAGEVTRAIDLAFEHFARYGRDDGIVALLGRSVESARAVGQVRQRFADLCASHDSLPSEMTR